ncbi:hypothetical protein D3C81_2134220 [compost metagenome]
MIGVHLYIGRIPTVYHSVPRSLSMSRFWYIPTYIRSHLSPSEIAPWSSTRNRLPLLFTTLLAKLVLVPSGLVMVVVEEP